jgi:transcriptional regulator with XRE-family HTH domain
MNVAGNTLGTVLCNLRQERRLSQEAFADLAGVHRTYISQLERGLKSPTIDVLYKLAAALDMRASDILARQEQLDT